MPGRFVAIPNVPDTGVQEWLASVLGAMKENVELLSGTRGESDTASRAYVRGDGRTAKLGPQEMLRVSADGSGFNISSVDVASLQSHQALLLDVQRLANDLAATRRTIDAILKDLTGA